MADVGYREVVLVEDLAPIVQRVLDRRWRIYEEENSACEGRAMIGPTAELALNSGIPERRIYGILKHETAAVDLDVADRLLLACGLFVELELPDSIYPESEVREATLVQASMMPEFALKRGIPIPPQGTSARRSFGGTMRKVAHREAKARRAVA